MLAADARSLIIKPALKYISKEIPYTKGSEDLLLCIACAESGCGEYAKQVRGPARGIFQMEPRTETDIIERFLASRPMMATLVKRLMLGMSNDSPEPLLWSPLYAAVMARIRIYRTPDRVPQPNEYTSTDNYVMALGELWKRRYNTERGKGTIDGFMDKVRAHGDFNLEYHVKQYPV